MLMSTAYEFLKWKMADPDGKVNWQNQAQYIQGKLNRATQR